MTANANDEDRIRRLASRLGAPTVERVGQRRVLTPVGILGLAELAASERLRSTGGRPTDPELTIKRQVGFKPETWKKLQDVARQLSRSGNSVAPAQLAAFLIEKSLEEADTRT
jgi:hypothetical protein